MKVFIVLLFFSSFGYCSVLSSLNLKSSIYNTESVKFIPHKGVGRWDNYLVMNLPFEPVADVFKQVLVREGVQLTSRGEAHLTIITPIEYWEVLKSVGITIDEINTLAIKAQIQKLKFTSLCIGRGSAIIDSNVENTFYIVVESQQAMEMRKAIQTLYISRGGNADKFLVSNYHPHVTVGFTKRDLHESDKVIKNKDSCILKLNLTKTEN